MSKLFLFSCSVACLLASSLSAQVFNDFEPGTVGAEYGFQEPRFSGTTGGNLLLTPNLFQLVQGFDVNATKVGQWQLEFADTSVNRWVRLTTSGATGLPNPEVDLDQQLQFDIFSINPIELAVGIRETGGTGPAGANGGSVGTIEWVGASRATASAGTPPGGISISGGSWQTVTLNLKGSPTFAFTGNGIVTGTWGVLESLAVTSGGVAANTIYVDNFQVVPVPEPSTWALLLAGAGLLVSRRRFSRR